MISLIVIAAAVLLAFKFFKPLGLFKRRKWKVRPSWDFRYEEEFPDTAGPNMAGVISNGDNYLFYHAYADEDGDPVICHIYSSFNMTEDTQVCSYPWTAENDSILLDALNNLEDPDDYCGEGSPLTTLRFNGENND